MGILDKKLKPLNLGNFLGVKRLPRKVFSKNGGAVFIESLLSFFESNVVSTFNLGPSAFSTTIVGFSVLVGVAVDAVVVEAEAEVVLTEVVAVVALVAVIVAVVVVVVVEAEELELIFMFSLLI